VTVCIAAICESLHKVVTVSDEMVTLGSISVDGTAEKKAPVHPNWFALYAADDITDVRPILDGAMLLLCSKPGDRFMVEAGDALSKSFAKRHQDIIKYRVLVPCGFEDLDDFYSKGKKILSISEINQIKRQIAAAKPACEFLLSGFDPMGIGHLLLQEANSPFQCYDDPGFWAIGSGQHEALAALFFQADKLGFSAVNSEAECVYHLLSAKFMAESNKFVGRRTFVTVHGFNTRPRHLTDSDIEAIRVAWEHSAIPKLPVEMIRQIPHMLERNKFRSRKNRGS
jgi:hypothetical protein